MCTNTKCNQVRVGMSENQFCFQQVGGDKICATSGMFAEQLGCGAMKLTEYCPVNATSPLKEEFYISTPSTIAARISRHHTMDILSCNLKSYENCYSGAEKEDAENITLFLSLFLETL